MGVTCQCFVEVLGMLKCFLYMAVERVPSEPWYNFGEQIYFSCGRALHERLLGEIEVVFIESGWGSLDERVKKALLKVPRHRFVPPDWFDKAYHDWIIPLDELALGPLKILTSSASQPAVVALMTQAVLPETPVNRGWKALEIGSGSGYQAAILREAGFSEIYGIEINERLVKESSRIIKEMDYCGIHLIHGNGKKGLPKQAPFDSILVTAAVRDDQMIDKLIRQLKVGGKLVLPKNDGWFLNSRQDLRVYTRMQKGSVWQDLEEVSFVGLQ